MVHVVHVKRRNGNTNKPVIDLAKKTFSPKPAGLAKPDKAPLPKPPVETKPKLEIAAALDGPPIAPELPEKLRTPAPWSAAKGLTDEQVQILDRIIQKAAEGNPKTYGLRLVLAASRDEQAGAWPIGLLSKAFSVAGHSTEAHAVFTVAQGCRVSRYEAMAESSLKILNRKLEAE
jgi:hypothetical protein